MTTTSDNATAFARRPSSWRERVLVRRLERLDFGRLEVRLPSGARARFVGARDGPSAHLRVHSPRLVGRLLTAGSMGFAEGYMAGEWDSDDLAGLIYLLHLNSAALAADLSGLSWLGARLAALRHRLNANSRHGARRNIAYHYDLGNDFYGRWLDESWTYSAALFARPDEPLAAAQRRKYDRLLDLLEAGPGQHILEVGCGWGGFACHAAASRGLRVTGITLSEQQLAYARAQARTIGVADAVDFRLCDYRDLAGCYDHAVSIEMYEAVGERYWPFYFRALHDAVRPGGRVAIQAITIADDRFDYYRRHVDFIQAYIFPGGMLASPGVFAATAAGAGLVERERAFFGDHYARTLMRWDAAVVAAGAEIRAARGAAFYRMWRYYLAYCTAGFTSGNIDLMQIGLERPR